PTQPPAGRLPATPFGRYRPVKELGRGGMGVVYLAERDDGTKAAVKTIIPAAAGTPKQVERFLREADVLRQLRHPHVVEFYESGEVNGLLYFAMEYVPGTNAATLVRRDGPYPTRTAVRLGAQMLDALAFAHDRKFVHRDIKPANLLLTKGPDGRTMAKLADFGLARVYAASQMSGLTVTGEIGGTAAFMPPEQVTDYREVRPAADQYAAAATLYNLLTAKLLYDCPASPVLALLKVLEEDPVPLRDRRPEVPEGLAAVIHRALARDPAARWPDARAFRQALLAAAA